MPGLITHNLVALSAIERIGTADISAFLLGALGPDVCYFHRAMPWQMGTLRNFGKKMHYSDPNKLFAAMNDIVLKNDNPSVKSFVEGFLCHYALDSTVHPFVYAAIPRYKDDKNVKYNNSFIHNLIEYKTDALILMKNKGKRIKTLDLKSVIPTETKAVSAASFVMASVVNELFADKPVCQNKFIQAYADLSYNTLRMQKVDNARVKNLSDIENLFHIGPALSPLFWGEPDYSYDYMNLEHKSWANPNEPDVMFNDSYIDLTENAVDYTCELVTKLRAALDRGEKAEYSLDKLFVNGKRIEDMK